METEPGFYNYPRATIERRKLLRQIRRMHLNTDGVLLGVPEGSQVDMAQQLAILERELSEAGMHPDSMIAG